MRLRGKGALGVWHGVDGPMQREVEQWYNHEHHHERVAIPGFLRARRYLNRGAGPRYFSRYDVTAASALASAPYLAALNAPSPWSQKIFPHYRDTVRGAFNVAARAGHADGGYLTCLRVAADAPGLDALRDACIAAASDLVAAHGVVAVEVWSIDRAATSPPSREKALRTPGEGYPGLAVLIDTTSPEHGAVALDGALPRAERALMSSDVYELVFQSVARGDGGDNRDDRLE